MKRVFKLLGLTAAAGAAYWFISEKLLRPATGTQSTPAAFRVSPNGSAAEAGEDLTVIDGVGPVYAARLVEADLATLRAIADAPLSVVAQAADVSETKAADWIEQARNLAE